jgi:acyl-coenzyme A thioesterase PaaI-like protein
VPLIHHELCFGCGRTNLFGLLLELEPAGPDSVAGRCFIKQDHQGPDRGRAHEGIVAAALTEAMALACGPAARAQRIEVEILAPAPVGAFLEVEARVTDRDGQTVSAQTTASAEQRRVAHGRGTFRSASR